MFCAESACQLCVSPRENDSLNDAYSNGDEWCENDDAQKTAWYSREQLPGRGVPHGRYRVNGVNTGDIVGESHIDDDVLERRFV